MKRFQIWHGSKKPITEFHDTPEAAWREAAAGWHDESLKNRVEEEIQSGTDMASLLYEGENEFGQRVVILLCRSSEK